jgi:hypothetical protein
MKTKIVYCKNANRKGTFPDVKFDFLGYYVFSSSRSTVGFGRLAA